MQFHSSGGEEKARFSTQGCGCRGYVSRDPQRHRGVGTKDMKRTIVTVVQSRLETSPDAV